MQGSTGDKVNKCALLLVINMWRAIVSWGNYRNTLAARRIGNSLRIQFLQRLNELAFTLLPNRSPFRLEGYERAYIQLALKRIHHNSYQLFKMVINCNDLGMSYEAIEG